MDINPGQMGFISTTCQPWESILLGVPVLPEQEAWGNIFAIDDSLKKGGHLVVTTSRIIYCPKKNPGAWPWSFDELNGLSVQTSLFKSLITITQDSGLFLRWRTLGKGAKTVLDSWTSWNQVGKAINHFVTIDSDFDQSRHIKICGYCKVPLRNLEESRNLNQHRCTACFSINNVIT